MRGRVTNGNPHAYPPFGTLRTRTVWPVADIQNRLFWRVGAAIGYCAELGQIAKPSAGACSAIRTPAGWTAVPGKVVLMTEIVLPVTIRDLTRQDLPSCAWGVSAWDLARLGRALERAERGEVDYLAVCPPSGLPVALGGVLHAWPGRGAPCGSWPSAGPGLVRSRGWEVRRCRPGSLPQVPARGWSFRASEGRSPAALLVLMYQAGPAGRGGGLGDAGELVTRGD